MIGVRSLFTICLPRQRSRCCGRPLLVVIWIIVILGMFLTIGVIKKYNLLRLIPLQKEECYLTKQEQDQLRHILRHVITIFDDMNVTYWLDYGTLIGALKSGDILSYDTDGDVAFLVNEYYKPQEVRDRLREFEIIYGYGESYFSRAKYGTMWVDVTRWTVHDGIFDGRSTKLASKDLSNRDDVSRDFVNRYRDENEKFPFQWIQPRKTIKFLNITAKVPNEAEKLIRHRYPYTYRFSVPYKFKCWI
ncbi:ribitol 5-phosphate transferase FKRP-like [Oculina patagonica]